MLSGRVILAYKDMEEDTYEFTHLRAFCKLFDFEVEQPEPLCVEKKRNCTMDEYNLYNWDDYRYDHDVRVTFSCSDSNLLFHSIGMLEEYAHLMGMAWAVAEISVSKPA
jgi:hypothetical protein